MEFVVSMEGSSLHTNTIEVWFQKVGPFTNWKSYERMANSKLNNFALFDEMMPTPKSGPMSEFDMMKNYLTIWGSAISTQPLYTFDSRFSKVATPCTRAGDET